MYGLDNASGVNVMPKIAPVGSVTPLWFTEGGAGLAASYPGQDWFNMVQAELLNVLTAGGVKPEKGKLNQLADAINKIVNSGDFASPKDLTDGLNKKLDKTSVVQGAGTSTTSVMSQDSVTKMLNSKVGSAATSIPDNTDLLEYFPGLASGFFKSGGGVNNKSVSGFADYIWINHGGSLHGQLTLRGEKGDTYENTLAHGMWVGWKKIVHNDDFYIDRNGIFRDKSASKELSDYPVGCPVPWPQSTAPSGFLICNGQSFNKTTYPLLAKAYPSGSLPDLRAEFIRGLDAGRNIDVSRVVLSNQLDQMQRITGQTLIGAIYDDKLFIAGAFSTKGEVTAPHYPTSGRTEGSGKVYFDSGTSPNARVSKDTAGETRPRNIAFLYIVRAA